MTFQPASNASLLAFHTIWLGVVFLFLAALRASARGDTAVARKRMVGGALGVALWLGLLALVVRGGLIAAHPVPLLVVFFTTINLASVALALSPVGRWLAEGVSIRALVAFQAFRLPLELVLHRWAEEGTIPTTMTWNGANFDVVSGIVALAAASWANRSPFAAWLANITGFVLLLNVMRVAVMSSPLPFAWPVTPPLQLAYHLPYALIAPVCVGGALAGHIVLTRALLRKT